MPLSKKQFSDKVNNYLGYMNYTDIIPHYDAKIITLAVDETVEILYYANCSYRMTALVVFGLTWNGEIVNSLIKYHRKLISDRVM